MTKAEEEFKKEAKILKDRQFKVGQEVEFRGARQTRSGVVTEVDHGDLEHNKPPMIEYESVSPKTDERKVYRNKPSFMHPQ